MLYHFGYGVEEEIFNTNMENENTFELQNEMLKNMTSLNESVYEKHIGNIKESIQGIKQEGKRYKKIDEEDSKIIYEFVSESNSNIYLYMNTFSTDGISVSINGEKIVKHSSFSNNEMINVGKREKGENIKIEIIPEKDIDIKSVYVYYENEEILKKHYEHLSKTQVDLEKIDNRTYKGKVNIEDTKKYIMFTIPYDKAWKITVDGKNVESKNVLDALMTVELGEGEHEILLQYNILGMNIGIICSIIGLIMLGLIILMQKITLKNYHKFYIKRH